MTDKEKNIEDELRGRQPFRVPEAYFESFAADFMRNLPPRTAPEVKVVSFYDRLKPWLYMAAMFAGIIFLFNFFHKTSVNQNDERRVLSFINADVDEGEDADFLEFFEEMYVDKYAISYIIDDYLMD